MEGDIETSVPGRFSVYNSLTAVAICNHYGVDECNIWGDYFYMEALMRLKKDWNPYW